MKTIRFISAVLLATVMIFSFNACDDDDDATNPIGSKIKKMEFITESIPFLAADLNYSDSKISGCDIYSPYFPLVKASVSVSYQGNKIIISSNGKDDEEGWLDGKWKFSYTLENGRAISCISEREEGDWSTYKNINYEYNNEGYLSEIIIVRTVNGKERGKSKLSFVYHENNLIKLEYTDDEYPNNIVCTISNSSIENKNNFPTALLAIATELAGFGGHEYNSLYASYLNIFGKISKHHPSSIICRYGKNDDDEDKVFFNYSIDSKNNINNITGKDGYGDEVKFKFTY